MGGGWVGWVHAGEAGARGKKRIVGSGCICAVNAHAVAALQNRPATRPARAALSPQVRKAFRADVAAGKTLVVADYGQLELRILAHMAGCKSMITAFEAGELRSWAGRVGLCPWG